MEYDASEFKESTSGGRMKYRCPDNKCTERFMQLNDVMYHIQNHSEHLQDELLPFFIHAVGQVEANDDDVKGKSIISCPLCQRACIRIRRHLNTAHKDDPFYQQALECCDYIQVTRRANKARQAQVEAKCDFCHKGFGCVDRMRLHSRYHCPKTPDFHKLRTCSQCAFQTTYRAKFVQHVASCHVGTVLCLHCEEIFADVESMNEHMQNQHSWLELLPCHLCEAITLSEENFDSHMMSHQPENEDYCPLISCQFCSKCYPTPHACWRHAWFSCPHNPQRRAMLSCNQCNFATSSEQLYADHMITEHNSEPGIFHCELCNRYYKSEHALKTHNHITHSDLTELKHHVCRLCREHFGTTKELDEHNQTHAEAGYYQCEICSTNCKHLSGLRSHILYRHKGKFPQTCPQCTSGIANKKCMEFH
uniref:C2H2-type domain-containing protein n=2 Tax=Capitella teleta TaxID=283909 RepID=X1ZK22_CAPTE